MVRRSCLAAVAVLALLALAPAVSADDVPVPEAPVVFAAPDAGVVLDVVNLPTLTERVAIAAQEVELATVAAVSAPIVGTGGLCRGANVTTDMNYVREANRITRHVRDYARARGSTS